MATSWFLWVNAYPEAVINLGPLQSFRFLLPNPISMSSLLKRDRRMAMEPEEIGRLPDDEDMLEIKQAEEDLALLEWIFDSED